MSEEISNNITLSDKLRALRLKEGLNQKELATILGVKQSYYSELENNKREFTFKVLNELALKFNISLDEFVYGDNNINYSETEITELNIEEESYSKAFSLINNLIRANDLKVITDENNDISSTLTLCNALLTNYTIEKRSFYTYLGYGENNVKHEEVLEVFKESAKIAAELNKVLQPYKKYIEKLYDAIQKFDDKHDRLFRYQDE